MGLRKYRKSIRAIIVDGSYEVTNGLAGMMRNVLLPVFAIIHNNPGITIKGKNQCVRIIVGMSQELMVLRKHRLFVEIRSFGLKPVHPAEDFSHARAFLAKYETLDLMWYQNIMFEVDVVVEDVLSMADMLCAYHRVSGSDAATLTAARKHSDIAKTPCVLLDCLLGIGAAFMQYGHRHKLYVKLQQAMARSPAFLLVRQFVRLTQFGYYKQVGCVVLGTFYMSQWAPPNQSLQSAEVVEAIGCIYLCNTGITHGSGVSFGGKNLMHGSLMRTAESAVSQLLYSSSSTSAAATGGSELKQQCVAPYLAAMARLLGCPNVETARFAAKQLSRLLEIVCSGTVFVGRLIDAGFVAAMERRMGVLSLRDEDTGFLHLLSAFCERSGAGKEAVFASNVIPLVFRFVGTVETPSLSETTVKAAVRFLQDFAKDSDKDAVIRVGKMYCDIGGLIVVEEWRTRLKGPLSVFGVVRQLNSLHDFMISALKGKADDAYLLKRTD